MNNIRQDSTTMPAKAQFNYNKLQAVACMTCSAAVSIGAIYWMITSFF